MTGEEDIDGLGAEYVLGSLDPAERAQVKARRQGDPALDAAIEAWQHRLAPLNEREPGISPPDHVYDQVLARIAGQPSASGGSANVVPLRVLAGSGRWRTVAAGVTALAACLALALGWFNFVHVGPNGPPPQARMDCGVLYKDFWVKFDREKLARISADHLAAVSRMALRAHDACQAGDAQDARALFEKLQRMHF
jgi:hypothetical protein